MKNELTIEQHFKNVEVAVANAVGKYDELQAIRTSFVYIRDYVGKLEKENQELKTKDVKPVIP